MIGDRASACDIGLRALRAVMADLDHHGKLGPLGAAILNALLFTEPEQLISWSVHAPKTEIASLAVTVFATAANRSQLESLYQLLEQIRQGLREPALLARLRHGLSLDGQPLKPAQVDWQNPEQLRFVLTEGKKRQIRRMCEQVGLKVVGLKRIRIGRVLLGNLSLTWSGERQPSESWHLHEFLVVVLRNSHFPIHQFCTLQPVCFL